MIILSNRMSVHSPLQSVIHIEDADVPFVSSVKNLGVTLASNLSMSQLISNTCKAAYIQIRHISSIRHLFTTQATQTLVCSLVLSRLDYCNSLFSGCPQYLLDKLQKVQNAAARLACKATKFDHIHPILETLHWLPVTHRIQYKILTICFNSISGTAPQYLSDRLQSYTPARQLRSASDTRTFPFEWLRQFRSVIMPYSGVELQWEQTSFPFLLVSCASDCVFGRACVGACVRVCVCVCVFCVR